MKHTIALITMTLIVIAVALSGCTSTTSPPAATTPTPAAPVSTPAMTPLGTATPPPATTAVPAPDTFVADTNFVNALNACYASIPVVSNITTHIALVDCVQNAPEPKGLCAQNYRSNVQLYLKDDDTTAGYNRENTRIGLAREAYNRNLSYNYVTGQAEACSQPRLGVPV
jgi:hypothetical protein